MAKNDYHTYSLTQTETILGWLWLPVYLVFLSWGLQALFSLLKIEYTTFALNIVYFSVNLLFVVLVFRRFLQQRFFGSGFWNFVQALILGFALYAAATWLIRFLLTRLSWELTIYNNDAIADLVNVNRYVMLAVTVIAAPIIEETLLRGVVFGSLRSTGRVPAYAVSCVIFIFMHVWQFFGVYPFGSVLLNCLAYIPAALALCWTYEKSGTIWGSITLHALINAASFGLLELHLL